MTESLIFSIIKTKFDILFASFIVSQFVKNSFRQYTKAQKTIIKYLKAKRLIAITFNGEERGRKDLIIKKFSNSDKAGNHATRKSTFSFVFMLNGGFISLYAKKQTILALLLIEIKYIALILVPKKSIWLKLLVTKLGLLKTLDQYIKIKVI